MLASLEHGPKYRHKKVNKGRHTLEMRTNGTKHDIPNGYISSHGAEKGKGMHKAIGIMAMHPKWLLPDKASWASDETTQPQTR